MKQFDTILRSVGPQGISFLIRDQSKTVHPVAILRKPVAGQEPIFFHMTSEEARWFYKELGSWLEEQET